MQRKFTKDHEWIVNDNGVGTVGITDYAQKQLGDVVYVTLTIDVGAIVKKGDSVAEIESVKSVSQVFAPASGEIIEFNTIFEDESKSNLINEDPYKEGWIFKIKLSNIKELDTLMDEEEYSKYIDSL
jgi:glycine cleavage system H protein